jgi:hypothetical protein
MIASRRRRHGNEARHEGRRTATLRSVLYHQNADYDIVHLFAALTDEHTAVGANSITNSAVLSRSPMSMICS